MLLVVVVAPHSLANCSQRGLREFIANWFDEALNRAEKRHLGPKDIIVNTAHTAAGQYAARRESSKKKSNPINSLRPFNSRFCFAKSALVWRISLRGEGELGHLSYSPAEDRLELHNHQATGLIRIVSFAFLILKANLIRSSLIILF